MVTEMEEWSKRTAVWLPGIVRASIPTLGICYGHQLLAIALGGEAGDNPNGREFGTVAIRKTRSAENDLLFGYLPETFKAHVSHTQSVLKLPAGAHCLAFSEKESVHAFFAEPYAWGIQFHPEFNQDIVRTYIDDHKDMLRKEGQNPEEILKSVTETPISSDVLTRFGKIVASH